MATAAKAAKIRVAKYNSESCARCGKRIDAGVMVEQLEVPTKTWVRWVHLGCKWADGCNALNADGARCYEHGAPTPPGGEQEDDAPGGGPAQYVGPGSDPGGAGQNGDQKSQVPPFQKPEDPPEEPWTDGTDTRLITLDEGRLLMKHAVYDELVRTTEEFVATYLPAVGQEVAAALNDKLEGIVGVHSQNLIDIATQEFEAAQKLLNDKVEKTMADLIATVPAQSIHVSYGDGSAELKMDEVMHEALEQVLELLTTTPRENVLLVGPTGCGKTFLAKQCAQVMKMNFGAISCTAATSEHHFVGKSIPNISNGTSRYRGTVCTRLARHGGLYLIDEVDAVDPNTLMRMQTGLGNRFMFIEENEDEPELNFHEDFVVVMAANTFGRGGDRMYVGRNQLDEATLDRFRISTIEVDYSQRIEMKVCPDALLRNMLTEWRKKIEAHQLRRVLSTRTMEKAYKMKTQKKWSDHKIAQRFFAGWKRAEIEKVYGKVL